MAITFAERAAAWIKTGDLTVSAALNAYNSVSQKAKAATEFDIKADLLNSNEVIKEWLSEHMEPEEFERIFPLTAPAGAEPSVSCENDISFDQKCLTVEAPSLLSELSRPEKNELFSALLKANKYSPGLIAQN